MFHVKGVTSLKEETLHTSGCLMCAVLETSGVVAHSATPDLPRTQAEQIPMAAGNS